MGLFEIDGLRTGLYPFAVLEPVLTGAVPGDRLRRTEDHPDAIAFVRVEEALDWETWMDTFAR